MEGQGNSPQTNYMNHISFFWGKQVEILFPGFPDNNVGLYVLSWFFIAVLAATVEVLKKATEAGKQNENPRKTWLIQGVLHMLRVGLAYMVMLSVTSYNGGIFLAAVIGHTLGFLISTRPVTPPTQSLLKQMDLSARSSSVEP